MYINLVAQAYKADSLPVAAQEAINVYGEANQQGAKAQFTTRGSPGMQSFATCGSGPVRGARLLGGVLYVVSGAFLYSVTSAGVATAVGGQISGSGPVSMDDNGSEIVIVNGTNGYIYDTVSGFRLISDPDFYASDTVTQFDTYFLFNRSGSNNVFASESLDGTSYIGTSFASKESQSDNVLANKNYKQILYVFGERTSEVWQKNNAANFPFGRIPGGNIDRGIAASLAFASADEALFFLGDDRIAYRISGTSLERISNHALEKEWLGYSTVSDAFMFSHSWGGHKFVYLTFPTANRTYCFDVASKLWHRRVSWDIHNNNLGRWRGNCAIEAYDKVLIGDAFSGQIGYLDQSVENEYDNPMYGIVSFPVIHAEKKRMFMSLLELDMETGVGLLSGQGSDPQIMLDWSDDGGHTFVERQLWASMGAHGNYKTRVRWTRLGSFRERIMRLTISDPVKKSIISARLEVQPGID